MGCRSFRFENMWLKAEGFVEKVKSWWKTYCFQGTTSYILAIKFKALKVDLKKWNELEFGNVTARKQKLWSELNALDIKAERYPLMGEEKLEEEQLRADIEKTTLLKEISWRQKSRMHLREGDSNTKFFHRMANSNRRNNSITSLMVDGALTYNQDSITDCIT